MVGRPDRPAIGEVCRRSGLRVVDPARTQRRSRDRHGVVEQSHDPTGQGVGLAGDAELDEQRKAVVVEAFADKVGAIELEDLQNRPFEAAAGRRQAAKGTPVGAVHRQVSSLPVEPLRGVSAAQLLLGSRSPCTRATRTSPGPRHHVPRCGGRPWRCVEQRLSRLEEISSELHAIEHPNPNRVPHDRLNTARLHDLASLLLRGIGFDGERLQGIGVGEVQFIAGGGPRACHIVTD